VRSRWLAKNLNGPKDQTDLLCPESLIISK
jgi:hypothetical protein